ncbi:hypothetical protein NLJ89_g6305 [Agrocybe chaxingu]|uniref:NAD-dependent epimerase/dehydratase domain-containing protein n=1 Tax=Agrocybe chaxingu TaxID=84603 RepID=A0A9W8MW54_9AGAR|nr:hypothetical protein NLJ89_g6305 [Agrocybe chaxingu]
MSGKLVLVTGATGFISGHVVEHALNAGYRVRGYDGRHLLWPKIDRLKEIQVPRLEFVQIEDITKGDLSKALEGVDVVIHVACPLPGTAPSDEVINVAIEGTLNFVRQGEKLGIKKFIVTSSFGVTMDPSLLPAFSGTTFTAAGNHTLSSTGRIGNNGIVDWGSTSREEIEKHKDDPFYTYFASKNVAERALWDFARDHPDIDIATVLPGIVYGPFAKIMPRPRSFNELSSNSLIYTLLSGETPLPLPPFVVDVRDVARAHIKAIDLPPSAREDIGNKRFLINAGNMTWSEITQHLSKARPEIPVGEVNRFEKLPGPASVLDSSKEQEVLGIGQFINPVKTMEDTANDVWALMKEWK